MGKRVGAGEFVGVVVGAVADGLCLIGSMPKEIARQQKLLAKPRLSLGISGAGSAQKRVLISR